MVFNQTQNPIIKNNLIDELRLNPSIDTIPNVVNPTIQPVFEVKKKYCNVQRRGSRATTGSSTIFITPSDKDFYLVAASIHLIKDVTCDLATGQIGINTVLDGTTNQCVSVATLTLTAQSVESSLSFNPPIKVDRNTALGFTTTFTAGACSTSATIAGYTEETAVKTV